MDWNYYTIGGETCRDPATGEAYSRLAILDRRSGVTRSGPISPSELTELIDGLIALRRNTETTPTTPPEGK